MYRYGKGEVEGKAWLGLSLRAWVRVRVVGSRATGITTPADGSPDNTAPTFIDGESFINGPACAGRSLTHPKSPPRKGRQGEPAPPTLRPELSQECSSVR